MKCTRIGGCLKETVGPNWPCVCDAQRIIQKLEKEKHLSDIEFVNQNARGK